MGDISFELTEFLRSSLYFPQEFALKVVDAKKSKRLTMSFNTQGILIMKKPKSYSIGHCATFLRLHTQELLDIHWRFQKAIQDYSADKLFAFGKWQDFSVFEECLEEGLKKKILRACMLPKDSSSTSYLQELWIQATFANSKPCKRLLSSFYQSLLDSYVKNRIKEISEQMQLFPKEVCYGKSRLTFGSCYTQTKRVRLSLMLALMPHACIDSTIIHELAHLAHGAHNRDFWNLVAHFDKNLRDTRAWRKAHSAQTDYLYYRIFE